MSDKESVVTLEELRKGTNPAGLDTDVEQDAETYAKREWQMTVLPLLKKVYGDDIISDIETLTAFQNALFEHKYQVLEASKAKEKLAKKNGLRWAV